MRLKGSDRLSAEVSETNMIADRSRTIDGLRGIAAMAVIVEHCLEFTPLNKPDATI
jgi:peptidoglycan/LPS O-acetylase OafA/YrhL